MPFGKIRRIFPQTERRSAMHWVRNCSRNSTGGILSPAETALVADGAAALVWVAAEKAAAKSSGATANDSVRIMAFQDSRDSRQRQRLAISDNVLISMVARLALRGAAGGGGAPPPPHRTHPTL